VNAVAVGLVNDVFVGGVFSKEVDFGEGTRRITSTNAAFVQKYGADGRFAWSLQFGGESSTNVTTLQVDGRGHLFVSGVFSASPGSAADFGQGKLTADGQHYRWLAP